MKFFVNFLWKTFLHDSIVKYVLSKDVCYIEVFFLAHLSTSFLFIQIP